MLTWSKACKLINKATSTRRGVRLGKNTYLTRYDKYFIISYKNYPIVYLNRKDHYIFKDLIAKRRTVNLINRYTSANAKLVKDKIMFDNIPYHEHITLNTNGDVVIPIALSPHQIPRCNTYMCVGCYDTHSIPTHCQDCIDNNEDEYNE